jgi:hypothetical protein
MSEERMTRAEEREAAIRKMRRASRQFYLAAVGTNVHAFIEFTGLINEYISMCQEAHEREIDFLSANTHSGEALPFFPRNAAYLGEKLDCIYGPAMVDTEVRQSFIRAFLVRKHG